MHASTDKLIQYFLTLIYSHANLLILCSLFNLVTALSSNDVRNSKESIFGHGTLLIAKQWIS